MGIFDKNQTKKLLTADDWFQILENVEKTNQLKVEMEKQKLLVVYAAQGKAIVEDFQQQELKDGKNPWGVVDKFEYNSHCGSYNFGAYEAAAELLTSLGFPTKAIEKQVQKTAPSHRGAAQFYSETRSILVIEKPKKKSVK